MNLQTIAKKAGVSVATASRVINNRPGVSKDKVKAIKDIIREHNFVPKVRITKSVPSVAPAGIKYGNILVLALGSGHFSASEIFVKHLVPICQGLAEKGFSPIVSMGVNHVEELPPAVQKKLIDGILLFGEANEAILEFISGIPTLWMTSHAEGSSTFILSGNSEIGQLGAEYCQRKGCHNVVAISSVLGLAEVHKRRNISFIETAKSMGMEGHLIMGGPAASFEESVREAAQQNIEKIRKADALFFPSDRTAAFVYPVLHRHNIFGKKNPVVLACGGERCYLAGLDPCPVSIDIGAEVIGQQAVEQIIWKIRNPNQERRYSLVIHPEIVENPAFPA